MSELSVLKTTPESECSCESCKKMCKRPCWGTPEDIQKIIDAGFGDRLGIDYMTNEDTSDTFMIQPVAKGYESKKAPFMPITKAGCTFWKDGLCELHHLKLKPIGGRLAYHIQKDSEKERLLYSENAYKLVSEIRETWENSEAREMVKKWCEEHKVNPEEEVSSEELLTGGLQMLINQLVIAPDFFG